MHALLAAGRILLLLVAAPASTEDAVGDFASGESRDLGSGEASSGSTGGASTYSERGFDFFAGGGQDTAEAPSDSAPESATPAPTPDSEGGGDDTGTSSEPPTPHDSFHAERGVSADDIADTEESSSGNGLDAGAIAGIVIGSLAGALLSAWCVWACRIGYL